MDATSPCFDIMRRMFDLTKDESLRDLTLCVTGENFKVHKFVMAATSGRLRKMITDLQSSAEGKNSVLNIEGVSAKGMKHLLLYIYSGTLPDFSNADDILELKNAAEYLEVEVQGMPEVVQPDVSANDITQDMPHSSQSDRSDNEQEITQVDSNPPEIFVEVTTFPQGQDVDGPTSESTSKGLLASDSGNIVVKKRSLHNLRYRKKTAKTKRKVKTEVAEDMMDVENDSEMVVQIVSAKTDESDDEYVPDHIGDDSDHLSHTEENVAMKPQPKPIKTISRHVNRGRSNPVKSEFVINGMDISKLFSTADRTAPRRRLPPPVPDPSLALKRGRPRLPNDYLFPNSPPYICPHKECTKECDTREKLKKHYRSHDERTHTCDTCSKKFLYRKDLLCHFRTHTGEKPFKCDVCGKGFSQKATLQYHLKMHDDQRMEFFCEQCGKHYKTFKGLQCHVEKTHNMDSTALVVHDVGLLENPIVCPVCAVRFRAYASMYHHMKRKHPGCQELKDLPKLKSQRKSKDASNDSAKHLHAVKNHPSSRNDISIDEDNTTSFFCMSCSLSFKEEATFMRHVQKCDKDTIRLFFMCGYCKQCFESDELRARHIETNHKKGDKSLELETSVVTANGEGDNIDGVRILNLENIF